MMLWLRRLGYLLGLALTALCYVLSLRSVFAAALCLCAILPLLSGMALLLCGMPRIRIVLPDSASKNERVTLEMHLHGRAPLSAMGIRAKIVVSNRLTGEITRFFADDFIPEKGGARALLHLESPRCGKLSVDVAQLLLYDFFGLFCKKYPVDAHASTLILPNSFEVKIDLSAPEALDIESDEYSPARPGDDPSELFGVRDYREGDRLKSVHWKLSEKYDRLVVKEMSQPVAQSILLLLDNCPSESISFDAADLACEGLISVSQALADLNIAHQIGWFDRAGGMMRLCAIASLDELAGEQGLLLSAQVQTDDAGLTERVLSDPFLRTEEFQRVLIFAPRATAGVEALNERTTLLLPEKAPENALSCLSEALSRILI